MPPRTDPEAADDRPSVPPPCGRSLPRPRRGPSSRAHPSPLSRPGASPTRTLRQGVRAVSDPVLWTGPGPVDKAARRGDRPARIAGVCRFRSEGSGRMEISSLLEHVGTAIDVVGVGVMVIGALAATWLAATARRRAPGSGIYEPYRRNLGRSIL